jgi:hypothetical protein
VAEDACHGGQGMTAVVLDIYLSLDGFIVRLMEESE